MKNFKELRIWQKGMDIADNCFKLISSFPKEEKFGLCLRITKCGISIPSNIAEGSSRNSEKEYKRFTEISLGSSFELETQLLISQRAGFGDQKLLKQMLDDVADEQKMIQGFISKLK